MKKLFNNLIAFILPNKCLSCNEFIAETEVFCDKDREKLRFFGEIQAKTPNIDKIFAVFEYGEVIDELIHKMKYLDGTLMAQKFGKLMADKIGEEISNYDFIVPVAIAKSRIKKRKFNQSALLVKSILKNCQTIKKPKPIFNLLIRKKFSKAQAHLNQKERFENLKGAFAFNEKIKISQGKILLIDDVMTTGATLEECARALKQKGFCDVGALVFAKTRFTV